MTDLEGWGYTRADLERLLDLSPLGCFAAEDEGRVIGVLTTTTYGRLAFLGAVIVRPESRGQGIGRLLMQAALLHLASTGVETVRLNAYMNVIPFYERLGFHGEYEVVRWKGAATRTGGGSVAVATRAELDAIAAFDAPYFGASRLALLGRLLQENPSTFLVAREGTRVLGYVVGSPFDGACEIGPWVVAPGHPEVARNLLAALAAGPRAYSFSGPERNPELAQFVAETGFTEAFRTLRMWWGKDLYPGDPAGVWAAGGLEKG
ncbi:MAG TPA: GNAT family N-acetyltransferase [Thermoplasmata archaeon]|nr:GNAT family N-acetyltransferase [Thermoplasmata archaeon]